MTDSTLDVSALFDFSQDFPEFDTRLSFVQQCQDHLAKSESGAVFERLSQQPERQSQFRRLVIGSEFAAEFLCRRVDEFAALLDGGLNSVKSSSEYLESFMASVSHLYEAAEGITAIELGDWDSALRAFRNKEMVRIIWRDLNRLADTLEITAEISALAETLLNATLDYHYKRLAKQFGTPMGADNNAQPLLIIGMGKLGAWELNLSSDIDLIFAYPEKGETVGGPKVLDNQTFFTRVGQALIKSLDAKTAEGFVFRVDMRLRPYGQSGALVSSFDALEVYYHTQGREWERFAMIKARVVASNEQVVASLEGAMQDAAGSTSNAYDYTAQLEQLLREFTYRRYVDFSAIDALRGLKAMISSEVKRKSLEADVKLGEGGIREIEFIAQSFQIIRGGRDTQLQDRRLCNILPELVALDCLPKGTDIKLLAAYSFLRNTEHAIQAFRDKQTQALPATPEEQERLALALGYSRFDLFITALTAHRQIVSAEFQQVIADPTGENDAQDSNLASWKAIWLCGDNLEESQELMSVLHDELESCALAKHLQALVESPAVVAMHAQGRERLDELMPRLLAEVVNTSEPAETLGRLLNLLRSVARRSAYLLLLIENPNALQQLIKLSEASPWIADRLANHPALLDELIHPESLFAMPSKTDLEHELRQMVLRIDEDDLEGQMEALRYFRSAHGLQVAACEVTESLPLMRVSDYLSELAEVILAFSLQIVWQQMVKRHGHPGGEEGEQPTFVVIGYGKLGGLELGHGSDLDLVFLHDANPQKMSTGDAEGKRSIDNLTFYTRLGQKLIHLLTTNTATGQVYEIDMRLRPSGNSGMLVSSFSAFEKYQRESAWTWEHQALTRARVVAGHEGLGQKFEALRQQILGQKRDETKLKTDVIAMRKKMRDHLGSSQKERDDGVFQLKQDAGGIVDIEFMVQYMVLAWSYKYPALQRFTDNIRILGDLQESELLSAQEAQQLIAAYKAFRSMGHRLALQQQAGQVDTNHYVSERESVISTWQSLLGSE